jgi:hypothetical protein
MSHYRYLGKENLILKKHGEKRFFLHKLKKIKLFTLGKTLFVAVKEPTSCCCPPILKSLILNIILPNLTMSPSISFHPLKKRKKIGLFSFNFLMDKFLALAQLSLLSMDRCPLDHKTHQMID